MFSPTDSGLELPLQYKTYHGRTVVCDNGGNELFIMEVIRPSLEARQALEDWAKAICEKFNGEKPLDLIPVPAAIPEQVANNGDDPAPVKRKRGRPRKSA